MLKINNHEVSEYFQNKDIADTLSIIFELYDAQCKISFIKNRCDTFFHFGEAIFLFAILNSSVDFENYDSSKLFSEVTELMKRGNDMMNTEVVLYSKNEFDCSAWVSANSSKLKKVLNQLFDNYSKTEPISKFYDCMQYARKAPMPELYDVLQYIFTALVFALKCFDKYEDNLPYSIALMDDLFAFCFTNSPAKHLVKKWEKRLLQEMDILP